VIKILGFKRVLIIFVLVALNAVFLASNYLVFTPGSTSAQNELRTTKSKTVQTRNDAEKLRTEITEIQQQKSGYELLKNAGFFSEQNRLVAKNRIEDIQKRTGILKAAYSVGTGTIIENPSAKEAGYAVLESDISINIEAMDDVDIYNFAFWMENALPGHMTIDSLDIVRTKDINEATIREIGTGNPVTLLTGKIALTWRTMVSEDVIRNAAESFSGEF
jgi:hypothetical protein